VSFITTIVPLVTGGIIYFKPWIIDEKEVRERSDLLRQVLLEKVNKRLQFLMNQLDADVNKRLQRAMNQSDLVDLELADLRGAAHPSNPDLIADFTGEFADTFSDINRMGRIYICLRRCRSAFLYTAVVALMSFIMTLLFESTRPYVSVLCLLLIVVHVVLIFLARRWSARVDQYEGRL